MRWEFQKALTALARRDLRVVLLWGDVGGGLWGDFRREMPERCINVGIREQATVSMAAGMAMEGLRPVVYTITPFLIERAFEQIKLDVNQQNLPVGLVGHSDGNSGPTHRELDAPAMMRLCRNIVGHYPQGKDEIAPMVAALDLDRPWFISLHE
jgi:transketolase